jgi:hypothetical protein
MAAATATAATSRCSAPDRNSSLSKGFKADPLEAKPKTPTPLSGPAPVASCPQSVTSEGSDDGLIKRAVSGVGESLGSELPSKLVGDFNIWSSELLKDLVGDFNICGWRTHVQSWQPSHTPDAGSGMVH